MAGVGHDARVGGEDAVDVGVDLADVGLERGGQGDGGGVEPPRPIVVTSLLSWLTPWNPATSTMTPSSSASRRRPGVTSMILALPWVPVVTMPACEPVNERACAPRDSMAIATRALEMRSPAVSSMSISRAGGAGET